MLHICELRVEMVQYWSEMHEAIEAQEEWQTAVQWVEIYSGSDSRGGPEVEMSRRMLSELLWNTQTKVLQASTLV